MYVKQDIMYSSRRTVVVREKIALGTVYVPTSKEPDNYLPT